VLLLASMAGAVTAGWTINAVVAMGEEYGWRGLMWDELRQHGRCGRTWSPARLGSLARAAHLQGYNYPGQPVVGVLAMVGFCTAMSPMLSGLRERTSSVVPVAAAHGIFNALAVTLLLFASDADRVLAGPVGPWAQRCCC
jgi:membrane protease YdiL (CAAX protease family)